MIAKSKSDPRPIIRCAVYTRKSTEEGLDQSFNSLDAQREAGEAYIRSQAQEGWKCLEARYDDGGFTGGNMDRPALRRLLADIEAGKIDSVVVYKVDRLSRSLLDFAKMVETFDQHKVSFVSVTQLINTSNSMGRLMLNVLLSFAQFEREIISERTRDKIAASRRKGIWSGGIPVLGYDVCEQSRKLVVNELEASQVRTIFGLYIKHQSIIATNAELDERGWVTKRWKTRSGVQTGGKRFDKATLHRLLTNVIYRGKLRYKDEVHKGEQPAIIDEELFASVQALLSKNGRTGGAAVRNQFGAILKGLLRCGPCGCAMTPAHSTKKGAKRYRYYVCTNAQKRGWTNCPTKSIPAAEIEQFIVDEIRGIGSDPALIRETMRQATEIGERQLTELERERRGIDRDLYKWNAEVRKLVGDSTPPAVSRLADLQERIGHAERRVTEIDSEVITLERAQIAEADVEKALAAFDPLWESMTLKEQARALQLLLQSVEYDGQSGKVAMTFHSTGIQILAGQQKGQVA